MALLDYTTINCTLPALQLGFCCLDTGGTWLAGGWCQFNSDPLTLGDYIRSWSSSLMRESIRAWNECASRAASANTTLAGVLEALGPLCVPAPKAPKRMPGDYGFVIVCLVVAVWWYFASRQQRVDDTREDVRELRKELCEAGIKVSAR